MSFRCKSRACVPVEAGGGGGGADGGPDPGEDQRLGVNAQYAGVVRKCKAVPFKGGGGGGGGPGPGPFPAK